MAASLAPAAGLLIGELDIEGATDELLADAPALAVCDVPPPQAAVDRARPVTAVNRTRVRFMTESSRKGGSVAGGAGSVDSRDRDRDGVPASGAVGLGGPADLRL